MFAESKDEICLVLVGTPGTDNPLADGESYENITIAFPMSVADFSILQYVQNDIQPSNVSGDCILFLCLQCSNNDRNSNTNHNTSHHHHQHLHIQCIVHFPLLKVGLL